MNLVHDIESLYSRELNSWELARNNYAALEHMLVKKFNYKGREIVAQFNPCRYRSAVAGGDNASQREHECFLCSAHQPHEQESIIWNENYKIQINPYPIFNRHLTVSSIEHRPQAIVPYIDDMMSVAAALPGYVLFYNGPKCGASAPFHQHFQAVPFSELPLCREAIHDDCDLSVYFPFFYIIRPTKKEAKLWFHIIEEGLHEVFDTGEEPMQNVFCWSVKRQMHIIIVPRSKHRPKCYGDGEDELVVSPASVEMAGVWPMVRESDFEKITASRLQSISEEVTISEDDKEHLMEYFITHT